MSSERSAVKASVVIRSCGRLKHALELLEACLAQDYPSFEVIVVEQSDDRDAFRTQLDVARSNPKVQVLEHGRLGPARARNIAVAEARGDVLVFIDDDDLPLGRDWLANHMQNFGDPRCVAVSGRHAHSREEDPRTHDTFLNRRWCLRYTFLRMPRSRVRHGTRIEGVTAVHGTNSAIRREAIMRAGGWDEERDHEENSFAFRFARVRRPGEYFAYDPKPAILRRLDIEGGVGRREADSAYILRAELRYSHRIVRRYFPGRFYAFYGAYVYLGLTRSLEHMRRFHPSESAVTQIEELARALPEAIVHAWETSRQPLS